MKVKANSTYIYHANGWDRIFPTSTNQLKNGMLVRVINLPSAPKANTMGQCYVADPKSGKFLSMVSTGSLYKVSEYVKLLEAKVAAMEVK